MDRCTPRYLLVKLALLIAVVLVVGLTGCDFITGVSPGEGFAIYLTRDNIPIRDMSVLSHVDIADTPVIGPDDIVAYYWYTHEIVLTPQAFARITDIKVPMAGKSFVVCVDRRTVYWGAFWSMASSVWLPRPAVIYVDPVMGDGHYLQIASSSPADPRSDPVIRATLEAAGKLK
ncbi:MAG: hypothetical protein MUO19_08315 [Dehalococcoidales bacterium]|nr:hypothetical protein [Dehalococcoidales bacterium]